MAEIINQIPGYEKGRVQRINATDEVSESFIVAQMAADLRKKWNTSVLCISLDGHKEAIESLIPQENAVGRVYVLDQKNPEFEVVLRKATGIIALDIEAASVKIRQGPPSDDAEDLGLGLWAGVVPITIVVSPDGNVVDTFPQPFETIDDLETAVAGALQNA